MRRITGFSRSWSRRRVLVARAVEAMTAADAEQRRHRTSSDSLELGLGAR